VLEKQMFNYAKELQFEDAAQTRDQIEELRQQFVRG
jgi:excinuclease ABC subunit B